MSLNKCYLTFYFMIELGKPSCLRHAFWCLEWFYDSVFVKQDFRGGIALQEQPSIYT